MFREMAIGEVQLSQREYMRQKRTLSERLLGEIFDEAHADEQG
jgi:predicted metal-binding transcription factor (methanogenesis marker protein 9)